MKIFLALLTLSVCAFAQPVNNGNARRLQNRNIAATAPADTNVLCWQLSTLTWKPCAASVGGGVSSVGLTAPGVFYSVAGSPVTAAGTLALSLINQVANCVFAGPASGGAVAPSCRGLVIADIPSIPGSKITSVVPTATALATLPTKCPAGSYPLGIDTGGNALNCTVSGSGLGAFLGTFTGTALTLTAATHGRGVNPILFIYDSSGSLVDAPINCKTAGGAAVGCADATSNGDIVIGTIASDTYTYAIRP